MDNMEIFKTENKYKYYYELIYKNLPKRKNISRNEFEFAVITVAIRVMQKINQRDKIGQWKEGYMDKYEIKDDIQRQKADVARIKQYFKRG